MPSVVRVEDGVVMRRIHLKCKICILKIMIIIDFNDEFVGLWVKICRS